MQTRCGTGTNDLTKREKSALYYEIELSKPWRSFCDRCVEVEFENILKETFGGKLGYGLNHRLSVLGNEYKGISAVFDKIVKDVNKNIFYYLIKDVV